MNEINQDEFLIWPVHLKLTRPKKLEGLDSLAVLPTSLVLSGAVLREREDAHIVATIQYTVDWLNQRGIYGEIEYLIDYLADVDHYAALKKGW
ncbi:unnamed protein product [Angiostrongylus costaricensis]|uniref:Hydrolase n=1 Tax=Angiostrongylus costaricensis TaxID=334426 RepID=A0A0R3PB80_ANGCS|nr:unnamed protein product [Angiostrongylus costaricensis]